MSGLDSSANAWFEAAWRTSCQTAVLVLLVFAVTRLLRGRLTARWTYLLWGLVVLRLALPVSPSFSLGAVDWNGSTRKEQLVESDALASAATLARPTLTTTKTARKKRDAEPVPTQQREAPANSPRPSLAGLAGTLNPVENQRTTPWTTWLFITWLVGALFKLLQVVVRELGFRRRLRREAGSTPPALQSLLEECRRDLGIEREVRVVLSSLTASPALTGWRKPLVLLPESFTKLETEKLRGVLLHELAHAKHFDVAANALLALLGCVWWFHPMVGLAFREFRSTRESLRDREALSTARSPAPLSYAETLLALAEADLRRRWAACQRRALAALRNGGRLRHLGHHGSSRLRGRARTTAPREGAALLQGRGPLRGHLRRLAGRADLTHHGAERRQQLGRRGRLHPVLEQPAARHTDRRRSRQRAVVHRAPGTWRHAPGGHR